MPKITEPGPTDQHWMCVIMNSSDAPVVTFHDDGAEAEEQARTGLLLERTSVYVAKVTKQGEHLRKRLRRTVKPAIPREG